MMRNFLKKAFKFFLILFAGFLILCVYAYYQMKPHIDAFLHIQKTINEANASTLEKEYGTKDKDKVFNHLILKYLNDLEGKDNNATS